MARKGRERTFRDAARPLEGKLHPLLRSHRRGSSPGRRRRHPDRLLLRAAKTIVWRAPREEIVGSVVKSVKATDKDVMKVASSTISDPTQAEETITVSFQLPVL